MVNGNEKVTVTGLYSGHNDRQRLEIKVGPSSSDHLKGFPEDTLEYNWKFYIDPDTKLTKDFFHIHQIKLVNEDESLPLITFSGNGNNNHQLFQVQYNPTGSQILILYKINWQQVVGKWLVASATVKYSVKPTEGLIKYQLKTLDGHQLFSYTNKTAQTLREGSGGDQWARPKWGLYRKLNQQLDRARVYFADWSVVKI
ncbi:unnamed protein product [Didymodactylos carnosus]|uniref:Uncharacterized protein n=1 Tax=Didymodactylos carnosus TaxID=1234261 RepID=A0A815SX38_9BILA|nr:unnamed protein product [Didymodactylos carnosus]CAF4359755.1 unnamed protein product [Didymodactylos carnosus]